MSEKEFDYMNVVPLVDVMLVMLTIVLTTSTFIATGGMPVNLPQASKSHGDTLSTQNIDITKEGKIYLNSQEVSLDQLSTRMADFSRETPVLIRADRNLVLQDFVNILDAVKTLGFKSVSLQTETKL